MDNVILFSGLLIAGLMLSAGCASTPSPQTQNTTVISNTPTPESTFVSPTRSGATSTVTPAPALTATHHMDYIIGSWKLVNAPYSCDAIFVDSGYGHLNCAYSLVTRQRNIAWSNNGTIDQDNKSYHIVIEGTADTGAVIMVDGHLVSDILPEGSYLVKVI